MAARGIADSNNRAKLSAESVMQFHLVAVVAFSRTLHLKLIRHELFFPGNLYSRSTATNNVIQPCNLI